MIVHFFYATHLSLIPFNRHFGLSDDLHTINKPKGCHFKQLTTSQIFLRLKISIRPVNKNLKAKKQNQTLQRAIAEVKGRTIQLGFQFAFNLIYPSAHKVINIIFNFMALI